VTDPNSPRADDPPTVPPRPGPPPAVLTGQQIREVALPEARWGSRGYDKTAVRRLLARLALEVDQHLRTLQGLQVAADAMAVEVTHRRGGFLPDHSLAELRISAQIDAVRQSEDVISVAQNHARELVDAARRQAAALLTVDGDQTDDVAALQLRLRQYRQLAHAMNDYLNHIVGVLAGAHTSFAGRFSLIDEGHGEGTG
jgi:cell division septum initiation protein DivIVA